MALLPLKKKNYFFFKPETGELLFSWTNGVLLFFSIALDRLFNGQTIWGAREEGARINSIEMWIALRGDLNKDFQRMLKKRDSSLTQDCRRGMFLSRLSIDTGSWNCYFGEVDKYLKPYPVVGNSSTAETPRNRRDPDLCWRELGGGHTVSWPAEPRFAAQGQTGWLAWRWGAKTESAWLLFQRGLLVRGGEEKPSEGRVGGVTDRISSPSERGIHSPWNTVPKEHRFQAKEPK